MPGDMDLLKYARPMKTPAEAHAEAMRRGARCEECPLYGKRLGPVMGEVRANAPLGVVGEAPGKTEVDEGRVFCLVPETLVLCADLTWRQLGSVRVGDELLTVDEEAPDGGSGVSGKLNRRWKIARVTATHRSIRPTRRVRTDRGELVGTEDHRVLVRGRSKTIAWRRIDQLQRARQENGHASRLTYFAAPWKNETGYAAGWLAGLLDGEGHVTGSRRAIKKTGVVGLSQNIGPVLDAAVVELRAFGFDVADQCGKKKCRRYTIAGGVNPSIELLGRLRPMRLLRDFRRVFETHPPAMRMGSATVLELLKEGEREVVDITTTAGTFIANGFVVHNCGASGVVYENSLKDGGLDRADVTTINVLGCRPPDDLTTFLDKLNRDYRKACRKAEAEGAPPPPPPVSPIDACFPRLEHDLIVSNSPVLLAIGGKALQAMARHFGVSYGHGEDTESKIQFATIKGQHGSPVTMQTGEIVCSSLHPAYAMREKAYTGIVREHIARAARIVTRGNKIDWREPKFILFPTIDVIEQVCARFVAETPGRVPVTLDIETDSADAQTCNVRCVGLGCKLPGDAEETVIVVPFRWMDGRDYWVSSFEAARAEAAVRSVLDGCDLVAHNGAYDTSVCQRVGLMSQDAVLKPSVMKRWHDTMIGHHNTDSNDLPHDLGFVTRQFTEAPLWKKDVDHKAGGGTTDDEYHLYNARDILTTSRLWPEVEKRIVACGTQGQFQTDSALAPVVREMSNLGVPVDEVYRGLLSIEFNKLTSDLRAEFQQACGKPDINPRSPQQIGTWLFEDKGYEPPLNPQGYEWEEGDDWSTSTPALLRLLDHGVDEDTSHAIDRLLAFRACETIRGRYIDGIHVRYVDDPTLLQARRAPAVIIDGQEIMPDRNAISVINPIWKIHVVPSGRWSSEPNVQNWPARAFETRDVDPDHRDLLTGQMRLNKKGKPYPERSATNLRRLVIAPPGHVFVGGDFSQIELRLYAVMAQDQLVLKAFKDGLDPHTLNAATLFATDPSKIMETYAELSKMSKDKGGSDEDAAKLKYLRTIAKRFVFLEAYGGEEGKLYSVMVAERDKSTGRRVFHNLTEKRVNEWHNRWHTAHPETKAWHQRVHRELRMRGYTQAVLDNRKRFFPGGPTKKNAPPNHEIQGSAAAIANDSVLRIAEEIPFRCWSRWTGLCLQVHDQIMLLVPEERADEAKKIVAKCMYHEVDGLPILADVVVSKDWARQG